MLIKDPLKILCKMLYLQVQSSFHLFRARVCGGGGERVLSHHWACSICNAFYADAHITVLLVYAKLPFYISRVNCWKMQALWKAEIAGIAFYFCFISVTNCISLSENLDSVTCCSFPNFKITTTTLS